MIPLIGDRARETAVAEEARRVAVRFPGCAVVVIVQPLDRAPGEGASFFSPTLNKEGTRLVAKGVADFLAGGTKTTAARSRS